MMVINWYIYVYGGKRFMYRISSFRIVFKTEELVGDGWAVVAWIIQRLV